MTTGIVVSVTDELVAELEALANECGQHGANWYEPRHMAAFPEYPCDQDFVVAASPATILALLAERAELKRDAERYRHIRANGIPDPAIAMQDSYYGELELVAPERLDTAIDAAMQSEAKP